MFDDYRALERRYERTRAQRTGAAITHSEDGRVHTCHLCVRRRLSNQDTARFTTVAEQYFLPHSIIIQIDNANYYKNGRVYPSDFHRARYINSAGALNTLRQLSVAMSPSINFFFTYEWYLFQ